MRGKRKQSQPKSPLCSGAEHRAQDTGHSRIPGLSLSTCRYWSDVYRKYGDMEIWGVQVHVDEELALTY